MAPTSYQIPEAILEGPALAPPPGVIPNLENPRNYNAITIAADSICITITIIFVAIRAYVKLCCLKKIHLEDVIMIPALGTFFTGIWCADHIVHTSGTFTHQYDIRLKDLGATLYIFHVGINTFVVTLCLTKAAILVEWSRIFVPFGTRNSFYWASRTLLTLILLAYTAFLVAENLSCIPHERIWNRLLPDGYCIDDKLFQIPGALVSPVWIFIVLLLPQRAIWKLQIAPKNKLGISLLFLVGILALGASIARAQATFAFVFSKDKTYTISSVYLWTLAECTCSFLAFCAPAAPRAFANRHHIANSARSFFSRIGLRGASNKHQSRQWPSQRQKSKSKQVQWDSARVYHKIKDTTSSLTRYNPRYDGNLGDPNQILGQSVPEDAILITTSFTAEVTVLDESEQHNSNQECPWATDTFSPNIGLYRARS
ncbi:hypothetical protein F5Y18DRAFT_404937 [Xylariaceae sp. FL1019]|nr:hypothetical protein F5Y18DRAFT_404937 [Xylariaceae sp. FL1019]